MKKPMHFALSLITLVGSVPLFSQDLTAPTGSWGDQGNGTYINPVLDADYSDPDVIRTGDDYYLVCSEFHFMGMPVLHSKDLVNWTIVARIYHEFKFAPEYDENARYARGSWAPAIRYHDEKYMVYFCTPDEGLFMSQAEKPEGPWEPVVQVVSTPGWEDPCPFWDDDGKAYLGRSRVGAGPIYIHRMSGDGKKLLDDGALVYTGPTAEGTKIYKRGGFYYLSIPEGGVPRGWQTVLRSKNIYGPYEKKVVLEKGSTDVNGPHQGAWIDLPNGDWWFMHFQTVTTLGRVCHLQPMRWQDGWPEMGVDIDRNGIGEPVYVWKKPDVGRTFPVDAPQSSDDFGAPTLGFQWAWNHNPVNDAWSLTDRPGYLVLDALPADSFLVARNTLTQKVMGPGGRATTLLKTDELADGQRAGLCMMGKQYDLIGIYRNEGKLTLFVNIDGKKVFEKSLPEEAVFLSVDLSSDPGVGNRFGYSTDNKKFHPAGGSFETTFGNWKGPKIGLFSYNEAGRGGSAAFDWFRYDYDGPKPAEQKSDE